jgi:hypothetical protein
MSSRRRPGDAGRPKLLCQRSSRRVRPSDGSCSSNSEVGLNQPLRRWIESSDALPGHRVKTSFKAALNLRKMKILNNLS